MRSNAMLVSVPRVIAVMCLVGLTATACSSSKEQYDPACGRISTPDFERDPEHCGGCDIVCDAVGAVPSCVAGVCVFEACRPGFVDLDGDMSNGCECRGDTPDACTLCLPYDRPGDRRDDDCDGRLDEDAAQWSDVIPLSRAHCGAVGASCLLGVGAEAVECALSWCSALDYAQGECGHGDGTTICAPVGDPDEVDRYHCGSCVQIYPEAGAPRVSFETVEQCFDTLDNDGNGVADDGPECEVLLANARTTACSGAAPSEDCPAYHLAIPTNEPRLPTLDVAFTYDVLIDRHEVTRAQYAAHLDAEGWCDLAPPMVVDPACHVSGSEAWLPAVDVSWRDALDYCVARGKRLPTYAEFARAALADYAEPGDPIDTQSRPADAVCDAVPAPVIADCGADEPAFASSRGGDGYVGSRHRSEWWLSAKAIRHLTGNVSEWMLDHYVDWCAAARAGHPELSVLVCPAESEPGYAHQRGPLVDLTVRPQYFRDAPTDYHNLLMGGAFAGPSDAWRLEYREPTSGGGLSYGGFRCARALTSGDGADPISAKMPHGLGLGQFSAPPR